MNKLQEQYRKEVIDFFNKFCTMAECTKTNEITCSICPVQIAYTAVKEMK